MEQIECRLGIERDEMIETVRVGMGEAFPRIRDPRVRHLASCIYGTLCPASPDEVNAMIQGGDWSAIDSLLSTATTENMEERLLDAPSCSDHRVLTCELHDLCPSVVQSMWQSHDPMRWHTAVYTFETSRHARLARGMHVRLFRCAQIALGILSDALEDHRVRHLKVDAICDEWHLPLGTWIRMREDARDKVVTRVTSIVVVSPRHRSAFTCRIASHEWIAKEEDAFVLHHRGRIGVTVRYAMQTVGGIALIHIEEPEEEWPAYVLENRMLPPALLPSLTTSSPCVVELTHASRNDRKRTIDVDELTGDDRHVRAVVRTWNKSYESRYAEVPTLMLTTTPFHFPETMRHRGFMAHRVRSDTSQHGKDAHRVLIERFGESYAAGAVRRLLGTFDGVWYVVYNDMEQCVSTFGMFFFRTSRLERIACCIDSFAVSKLHQGAGVGNITFHAMLRGVCDHVSTHGNDYYVFAQCVRTGDARHFWYDKLDESTLARSLLLQAFHLDPQRVPVQLISQCTPRAREYRSSDLIDDDVGHVVDAP